MHPQIRTRYLLLALILAGATAPGCSTCGKRDRPAPAPTATSLEVPPGRLELPWTWKPTQLRDTAMPSGCRMVSAPLRFHREAQDLVFLAVPGDTRTLAVATGSLAPDAVSFTRGLVPLDAETPATVRDVPWLHVAAPPVMASSIQGWVALLSEQDAFEPKNKIWLWREGGKLEVIAQGDRLSPVDARCSDGRCVVLTTRAADVATRGASLWVGAPDRAVGDFERMDVDADQVAEGSIPVRIARWDPSAKAAVVVFDGPEQVSFMRVQRDAVQELGKVGRGAMLLDATSTRDAYVAVMTRGERDAEGCVKAGGGVEIAATGGDSAWIPSVVPPNSGYARGLGDGAFVTWIAPINCKAPDRKVVYGVVLGAGGQPVSSTMAIGNADGHAMTTEGDEVHVWLRDRGGITWLRAKCEVGGGEAR